MAKVSVLEGAEDFSFGEGPVGALLVHGFTGTPQGMRLLGEYLAANGIAVSAPRLPGHGTTWQDLNAHRSEHWRASVQEAHKALAARTDEVFLVGLSFGAALSLDFTARNPHKVAGLVLLAPFVLTKDPRRFASPIARLVLNSLPGAGNDIADPEMREIVYERVPTKAAYSMLKFCGSVRRRLSSVHCPTLLIHSRNDHTAHPANASLIHKALRSRDKELVWLDRSYHVITLDLDREEIYERTLKFIKERAKHAV